MAKNDRKTRDVLEVARQISDARDEQIAANKEIRNLQTILALDLATKTGYAYSFKPDNGPPWLPLPGWMGQLDLSLGTYDSGPMRPLRLWTFLDTVCPSLVAFEGHQFSLFRLRQDFTSTMKAHELSASLRSTVALWCQLNNVPCYGIPIATIKQRACGLGNANKVAVIKACNAEFGTDFDPESSESLGLDNVADAAYILAIAAEEEGTGLVDVAEEEIQAAIDRVKLLPTPAEAKKQAKKSRKKK